MLNMFDPETCQGLYVLGPDFPVGPSEPEDLYNHVNYQILLNIIYCSC